ncbi:hypothetical protein [Maribellus sp. YY47]|uniref:hypothetical protein n=1 Tax=Maribellus sp. YY47 TaxID=2929486 RepID=UPI002001C5F5|nr:hypothetical protein [Maribellus sp. YY47]MCK3684074.1 hypothetical protein [Maribellus sp. YY47]
MNIKRLLYCFSIILLAAVGVRADEHRGVYFRSKEVGVEERTGIDLTKNGAIKYLDKFTIEFEISFREYAERYGYIFRLTDKEGEHKIDLICKIDETSPDLILLVDRKETNLQLGMTPEQKRLTNVWYKIRLNVDPDSREISLQFADKIVTDSIAFPKRLKLKWAFGCVQNFGKGIGEVPPISVRNIKFYNNDYLTYFWPLSFTDGTTVRDSVHGKSAEIVNPAWVVEQHQNWRKIRTLEFDEFPQIVYKEDQEEIYFVQRSKKLLKYNLNTGTEITLTYKSGNPFYEDGQQVFFNKKGELVAYSDYRTLSPKFDEKMLSWNNSFDTIAYLPKYWHHNHLLHPENGKYTAVCGYGFFNFFNTFRVFDEASSTWSELEMNGDRIGPRYLAALGQSQKDSNVYYLYGGVGNEDGKQIFGKNFYYDLFKINFKTNHVTKMYEPRLMRKANFAPLNTMIVDDSRNVFYTLCFSLNHYVSELQLYKGSMLGDQGLFFGSKIPYTFTDINSYADLYQWPSHNKLVVLTMHKKTDDRYEVNLYSINFPPSDFVFTKPVNMASNLLADSKYQLLLAVMLLIVGAVIFFLIQRSIYSAKRQDNKNKLIIPADPEEKPKTKGKVLLFGGFQVFDERGKDITYRFSPTLRDLFLMMLLFTMKDNKGISSTQIQEYLWPEKPEEKAKNNRGVNIKKLRFILEDIGDISISYDGSQWRISHSEEVFCDLEYIRQVYTSKDQQFFIQELKESIETLAKGPFLDGIEKDWLNNVKADITKRIVRRLEDAFNILDIVEDASLINEITEVIFMFDQVNESALKYSCKILYQQGKYSLAQDAYNQYAKRYKQLYGEDYQGALKELVK